MILTKETTLGGGGGGFFSLFIFGFASGRMVFGQWDIPFVVCQLVSCSNTNSPNPTWQ